MYCAATPRHPELLELATRVGEAIADRGWTLVSGGGNVSAMGAVAAGARSRGGRTVGVIPKALVHRELADIDADELLSAVASLCMSAYTAGSGRAERMVALMVDGLRYGAGAPAP